MTGQRILGLDYGTARVGVAVSDPLHVLATPLETLRNDSSLFRHVADLVQTWNIARIVVGHPLNLKGEQSRKTVETEAFAEQLGGQLNIAVELWDERFSTTIAHQQLTEVGVKHKARRARPGRVDAMAAVVILQSYLDRRKTSTRD